MKSGRRPRQEKRHRKLSKERDSVREGTQTESVGKDLPVKKHKKLVGHETDVLRKIQTGKLVGRWIRVGRHVDRLKNFFLF